MSSTRACLDDLHALASEPSSDKRRDLLHRVTDLFEITLDSQGEAESNVFGDVMERIAYEVEIEARIILSQRMSAIDRAPRRLIRRLANDDISVARPVLERSTVLTDEDLIEVVRKQTQDHMQAVAGRRTLSRPVTAALVENGNDHVITRVTGNKGAQFSRESLEQIAERARFSADILTALGRRTDIPSDFLIEIKRNVSSRMKTQLAATGADFDIEEVESLVEMSADRIDLSKIEASNADLLEKNERKELTEMHLVKLARERRMPDVVRCLSLMTGLDDTSVSFCLTRADVSALGILCKAQAFANSTYLALLDIRLGRTENAAIIAAKAMRQYENLSAASAERAMRFLKVRRTISEDAAAPQTGAGKP